MSFKMFWMFLFWKLESRWTVAEARSWQATLPPLSSGGLQSGLELLPSSNRGVREALSEFTGWTRAHTERQESAFISLHAWTLVMLLPFRPGGAWIELEGLCQQCWLEKNEESRGRVFFISCSPVQFQMWKPQWEVDLWHINPGWSWVFTFYDHKGPHEVFTNNVRLVLCITAGKAAENGCFPVLGAISVLVSETSPFYF